MSTTAPVLNTVPPGERVAITNEKVTGPAAAEMLRRSGFHKHVGELEILDNATGAGILVDELLRLPSVQKPKRIVAGDIDDKMLGFLRNKKEAAQPDLESWRHVEIMKIDQQAIPFPGQGFTHVFRNFGIFFCADDTKALSETYRMLKPGGLAGFTSWKSIAWWSEITQPALAQYMPEAPELPKPDQLFPARGWSDPGAIRAKLEQVGFTGVEVSEYSFTPDVDPELFAEATGVLVKIVAKRLWSEDAFERFAGEIEAALLRYMHEHFTGGKWDGKMTAIVSLARRG